MLSDLERHALLLLARYPLGTRVTVEELSHLTPEFMHRLTQALACVPHSYVTPYYHPVTRTVRAYTLTPVGRLALTRTT